MTGSLADETIGTHLRVRESGSSVALRVLIIEDHRLIAGSLSFVLRAEGMEVRVAPELGDAQILAYAEDFAPDVVLLDYDLGEAGVATALIRPLADLGAATIMLTGEKRRHVLGGCIENGAVGVIDKTEGLDAVLESVFRAAESGTAMTGSERHDYLAAVRHHRSESAARLALFAHLTPREEDVLMGLADGKTAAEMAEEGFVSVWTIRGHISSVLGKLGVGSQLAAVAKARQAGWLR